MNKWFIIKYLYLFFLRKSPRMVFNHLEINHSEVKNISFCFARIQNQRIFEKVIWFDNGNRYLAGNRTTIPKVSKIGY